MNVFKDLLTGILSTIQELKDSIIHFTNTVEKISEFFSVLFKIIPLDFAIFLLGLVLLLIFINALSPTTTKWNLLIAVIFLDVIWVQLNYLFYAEVRFWTIFSRNLIVILPLFASSITGFLIKAAKEKRMKSRLEKQDFPFFRQEFDKSYHNIMSNVHKLESGNNTVSEELKRELVKMDILIKTIRL